MAQAAGTSSIPPGLDLRCHAPLEALVRERLERWPVQALPDDGRRRAAVVLALADEGEGAGLPGLPLRPGHWSEQAAVLVTLRAATLRAHAGQFKQGTDALFILLGAIMVLAMHAGFAFLELGTVRKKNQVNALVKILVDFAVSTIAYFFVGYGWPTAWSFFVGAETLAQKNGYELVKFFFLLTFAAAIPAIVSGGIAERARFGPQLIATAVLVGWSTRCSRAVWNQRFGMQAWIKGLTGAEFHDFAGSVVVHAVGGWIGLAGGAAAGRARQPLPQGRRDQRAPAVVIPFLALGAWVLAVGWFGFNVMSAQTIDKISGLVAVNSLMAMVGGTLVAVLLGKQRPRLRLQRPAGRPGGGVRRLRRDAPGRRAGGGRRGRRHLRVMFTLTQNRWKIDDVLGVWPLHGLCGAWGGMACGIFGSTPWAAWAA
jgi:Amt family ammonium transporter